MRVVRGAGFDVAVNLRKSSPTHIRSMVQSLDDIVEPEDWEVFNEIRRRRWRSGCWTEQAALVPLKRYAKAPGNHSRLNLPPLPVNCPT